MEVIAVTQEGDYIIRVSKAEWGSLRDGVRPNAPDDIHKKYDAFWETEAGRFLSTYKHQGKSAFWFMYRDGKFDGSIDSLRSILQDEKRVNKIPNFGKKRSLQILQELSAYESPQVE